MVTLRCGKPRPNKDFSSRYLPKRPEKLRRSGFYWRPARGRFRTFLLDVDIFDQAFNNLGLNRTESYSSWPPILEHFWRECFVNCGGCTRPNHTDYPCGQTLNCRLVSFSLSLQRASTA